MSLDFFTRLNSFRTAAGLLGVSWLRTNGAHYRNWADLRLQCGDKLVSALERGNVQVPQPNCRTIRTNSSLSVLSCADALGLPKNIRVHFLYDPWLAERALRPLASAVELGGESTHVSFDAEWNLTRRVGVSIVQLAPHFDPNNIYLIPVHRYSALPPSLHFLLTSPRVIKVGVKVASDLTRLKKQFATQLSHIDSFETEDLKQSALQRGVIGRKETGSLEALVRKILGKNLLKDDVVRMCQAWEAWMLSSEHRQYAALDVYASRLVHEELSGIPILSFVRADSPVGSPVAFLTEEDAKVAAYGRIAVVQPKSLSGIRVSLPAKSRVVVDIERIVVPSAVVGLHSTTSSTVSMTGTSAEVETITCARTVTLMDLYQEAGCVVPFQIVAPITQLVVVTQ